MQIEFQKTSNDVYQDAFNHSIVSDGYGKAAGFQPNLVYQKFWPLKVHPYLRIVKLLSRCTSIFHCREPSFRLIFSLVLHVYEIYINSYVFFDNPRSRATLLKVMSQRNLFRSHDFVVYFRKMSCKLQYSPSQVLRTTATCLLGVRMRPLFVDHRQPFFSSRVLSPHSPLSSPKVTLPSESRVGGGSSLLSCPSLLPYIVSKPNILNNRSRLQYVAYVDDVGLKAYPSDKFVHANIPLPVVSQLLSITVSRYIAMMHGIAVGSHCTVSQLKINVDEHDCLSCASYFTIFVEHEPVKNNTVSTARVRKHRKKQKAQCPKTASKDSGRSKHPQSIEFPPSPCSIDFEHTIIKDSCRRMDPVNFEEVGCAVCGELRRQDKASRLKSVKNFLNILEVAGVTRVERAANTMPIKEFKGPVLDYSCSLICDTCRADIHNGKVPRLALARGLWLGKVPPQLSCLTFVEKLLVAKVRHTCAFVKVASGMRKMKANIVAFESPVPKIYNILPPPRDDLDEMLAILFTGPCKPTKEDFSRTPFFVRRNAVINALEWLKLNHADYADIEISHSNAMQYDDDMPPVSVEYRRSETNKVPEGTSVFDNEEDDGTTEGDCAFTVHGLTGEVCNTMTPNALKALALRHLNSGGKVLAVGHSDRIESMWNNPQLYPQMFPWLFPYGVGGIGTTHLSHKEHKRHLLMYHDKRFQTDVNFPFVAFSHEQMMANTTQSFLLVDQTRFGNISERLMNIDWATLNDITARLEVGDHINPQTDAEKQCFQLLHDLDAVSGKMHGSTTSKKYMRNEIWSLINHLGAPSWYITLSPADIQHPICIYFADTNEKFSPDMPSYDDRTRMVCQNPVSGARFFHFMVQSFLEDVLGVNRSDKLGFYGTTSGYYGTVEQQGRLTLHLHMLLWILENLNPEDVREKILGENSIWRQKLIDWLEHCHKGEFITGSHAEVSERIGKLRDAEDYVDPTMTLPVPPPRPCKTHVDENLVADDCHTCSASLEWSQNYQNTVDDLLLRSNVHSCNRGSKKDGTRKKNKMYAGCMDNKWGKCKARFPRATSVKSVIDETGAIIMRKLEPWINTFTPLVTYLLRCNTDVTSLSSGTAIKSVTMYVSDYITKTTLKTHVIFDTIRSVFQKNNGLMSGSLPAKEKARRFMTKVANLLSAKAEMGAPMIAMYLLGNPDHYTGHTFVPFYWQSYVQEAGRPFNCDDHQEPQKITVIKKRGRIIGLSRVHDYIHRPEELANVNLYDWIRCYKREKLPKDMRPLDGLDADAVANENETSFAEYGTPGDLTISLDEDSDVVSEYCEEKHKKKVTTGRRSNAIMHFCSEHPLSGSHGVRYIVDNAARVPNFVGANLPRRDQGDREYYCRTMLVLFKPWRKGTDLKATDHLWDEEFQRHSFSEEQVRYMRNFNVRYECLDARDDYRAQMKKSGNTIIGSWVVDQEDEVKDDPQDVSPDNDAFDDTPTHPLDSGPINKRRINEIHAVTHMMTSMGWTDPSPPVGLSPTSFTPDKIIPGVTWEQEIETLKQKVLEEKIKHYTHPADNCRVSETSHKSHVANVVKVVDKSYLESDFRIEGESNLIDSVVKDFSLNGEQERALRIVANHAISPEHDQLRMYLGGIGGTGKSQVIKALSSFFTVRNEAHRFIIVAPTGTAAALLGGSTYHSMFGINERSGGHKLGNIKAKLEGVEYVFFDEVSMLSARDMYRINVQLSKVFENSHVPFGGLNMIFSGDFAQLPPAVGGENVSLYSRSIGSTSTDMKSQEEAIGKALWHQISTVVILRKNMRQNRQSNDDNKLRVALENMRYKACKPDDIVFLRTRISCNMPGRPSVCQESFRNVSIITGTNLHKDEINRLGALRFAHETGQSLTDFFSDDLPLATTQNRTEQGHGHHESSRVKRVSEITDEMRTALWSQPPSSTDKHIAGKLSLCIGMPVMIRHNYATEICMTRGQEGFVLGWQSKRGSSGQQVIDTLFVKLKDPPTNVNVPGLPENVVPVYPTTTNIDAMLPNDEKIHIARTQVEVLINFAMTDFASQGKTRPWNVCDLNNLRSHQSYYTALSRSATAEGTLILQGFDPKVITGRCSGALRQEFRELELLDEITRLRHLRKLPLTITGDTRNNLISAFREWKGEQYVPHNVHSSIRWSKSSPWLESEVLKLDERLEMLEKQRQKKKTRKFEKKEDKVLVTSSSSMAPVTNKPGSLPTTKSYGILGAPNVNKSIQGSRAAKRRRSSGNHVQRSASALRKASSIRRDWHAATKRKIDQQSQQTYAGHYEAPIGCRWSQNSCAYDSLFTPLFVLWCSDREYWARKFSGMGNAVADLLLEGFFLYERGEISLENVRDDARRMIARSRNGVAFGCYTSIENVCSHTLSTNTVISETYYVCPNGHHVHHSNNYDAFLSAGVHEYRSIAEWVSTETLHAHARCQICTHAVGLKLKFCHSPPLLVFSISRLSVHIDTTFKISIENSDHVYTLAAVIYYANSHFTAQIITRDGRIWFYDGMRILDPNIQPNLEYVGTIHSQINMHVCRGGEASALIYVARGTGM